MLLAELLEHDSKDVMFYKSLPPKVIKVCEKAVHDVDTSLKLHGLLKLGGGIRFVPEGRTHYDTSDDWIYLNPYQYDVSVNQICHAIAHELGHRLHKKLPWSSMKIWWKHVTADKDWHVTEYARSNHLEMFAETFRKYLQGDLKKPQAEWMGQYIDRYLKR